MNDDEQRREAVRRRLAGESTTEIAEALGRTDRWVRKWVSRHAEHTGEGDWAAERSRAPHRSPNRTPDEVRDLVLAARSRLTGNPKAQYGALAVQWELRRLGVDPIPPARTIERIITAAGLSRLRRRSTKYVSKHVPYPHDPATAAPGEVHQIDMVGPRHLFGGIEFYALNLIDCGSHEAASRIVDAPVPTVLARQITGMWATTGVPRIAQFDNHSNFRGGIPPASAHFGPVVATCLDLGVTPRFIPLREPWRNGVAEHFNDVWDKSFFRTDVFTGLHHLTDENAAFVAFHNAHHRYSAHQGATPDEINRNRPRQLISARYQPPTRLPDRGRIEVVRYVRSNRRVELFGHHITVDEDQTHQYVTAVIKVRSRKVIVVTRHGEIIHTGDFALARSLR